MGEDEGANARDVLIVDDDPDQLELGIRALTRAGISATGAKDFGELEAALARRVPTLILMDVHMPELFGDDVAAILRLRSLKSKIYLYSSLDESELATLASNAGVDGAIPKSAGIGHLVDEVRRLLS